VAPALLGRDTINIGINALNVDAPNSSLYIFRDEQRAVWSDGQSRWPERCTTGILHGASKAVGKGDIGPARQSENS
jgi:hypothetical protein